MEETIITILYPREPVHLGMWKITCHTTQIHCNHLVDHLQLVIYLRVEGHAHTKSHACPLEEVTPHVAGKHRVPITDNGQGKPMQLNDTVEEGVSDRRRGVGVTKHDKMRVHGEGVDDGENDRLATNLGSPSMKSMEMFVHTWDGTSRGCRRSTG